MLQRNAPIVAEYDAFIFQKGALKFVPWPCADFSSGIDHPVPGNICRAAFQSITDPARFDAIIAVRMLSGRWWNMLTD